MDISRALGRDVLSALAALQPPCRVGIATAVNRCESNVSTSGCVRGGTLWCGCRRKRPGSDAEERDHLLCLYRVRRGAADMMPPVQKTPSQAN